MLLMLFIAAVAAAAAAAAAFATGQNVKCSQIMFFLPVASTSRVMFDSNVRGLISLNPPPPPGPSSSLSPPFF